MTQEIYFSTVNKQENFTSLPQTFCDNESNNINELRKKKNPQTILSPEWTILITV